MPDVIQLPDGQNIPTNKVKAWEILLGCDRLTRARAVGAIRLRSGHDNVKDKLCGLVPVVEDWHTRQTFLKVYMLL